MKAQARAYKVFEFFKYACLALMPILSIYNGISFLDLGILFLLGIMMIEIIMKRGSIDINANLFIIILFLVVLNMTSALLHLNIIGFTGYIHNGVQMVVVAVICAYFVKKNIVQKDVFYQYIKVVALISSIFLFVQYYFYTKGIVVSGYLSDFGIANYDYLSIAYGRPNSFFLEPAHFAIYVLPVYSLSLFKKQYITSGILLLALLLSTSSTGIIAAILVTVIFIAKEQRIPVIVKWILALVVAVVILHFIPILSKNEIFVKMSLTNLERNIRVFGTIEYFQYLGVKELLCGVGINQIANYMRIFANLNVSNYSNSLFFSFLSFGLLGGIVWNSYLVSLFHLSKNKTLYMVFLLIYFSDQILFNRNLIYLLLILFVFSDRKEDSSESKMKGS